MYMYMITLEMQRKKERRKKERQTPEAYEKMKMSCFRWDLNPRHSLSFFFLSFHLKCHHVHVYTMYLGLVLVSLVV